MLDIRSVRRIRFFHGQSTFLPKLVIVIFSLFITLAICEIVVRSQGGTNENGDFVVGARILKPYRLPVALTQELIDEYSASSSYLMYDPFLGWTNRPNTTSADGLYRANGAGIRADVEYDLCPQPGTVRIALFGDSFTHGDDVPLQDSWAYQLEMHLNQRGIKAEVINFGVKGFGIDQAFLRWQHQGRQYKPDIVVFGFQHENIRRVVNIVRYFYVRIGRTPFFKPRFVLEDDQLRLINSPTPLPEEIPDIIANFKDSPLAEYEYFFDQDDYIDHWWLQSKLVGLLLDIVEEEPLDSRIFYDFGSEPVQLALAIIEAFKNEVESQGATFMAVHLPHKYELSQTAGGRPFRYADILNNLDANYHLMRTEGQFDLLRLDTYFQETTTHYSAEGYQVVAGVAADAIEQFLDSSPIDFSTRSCVQGS